MTNGQSADKSFAYLLGVYLGDGCVYSHQGRPAFVLSVIDEDFIQATKEALTDLTPYKPYVYRYRNKIRLHCGDPLLATKLAEDTDGKRILPSYVWEMDDSARKELIAGIMDSEGFVQRSERPPNPTVYIMGYKSCDTWVPDFIRLLESVGVKIGKVSKEKPQKEGHKTPTRFSIKMRSWYSSGCYFKIARKENRIKEWAEGPQTMRRLISETIRLTPIGDDIVRTYAKS